MVQGRPEDAIVLYKRALEVRDSDGTLDNVAYAENLEHLGTAYDLVGQRELASSLYAQAIEIRENVQGTDDPALARTLHDFARDRTRR